MDVVVKAAVQGLGVRYGFLRDWALEDIDLCFEPGSVVLVSGPCGSGKTTLLHCLAGIIPRIFKAELKGRALLNDMNAAQAPSGSVRRLVGVVLQDADAQIFNPEAADEIAFGCENLGLAPEVIEDRIQAQGRRFGLNPSGRTAKLSGGQKQKLVIASVLAMEQPLLLLDEPLAHLDREGAASLIALLPRFRREGRTVVIAEHRLDVLLPHVDRVIWLEQGRVKHDLPAAESKARLPLAGLGFSSRPAAPMQGEPLLSLSQATVSLSGKDRLRNLDLSIRPGERLALLGSNGAGKTTLLRTLAGLQKLSRGAVRRNGLAPGRGVGFVFQRPAYQLFMDSVWNEVDLCSPSAQRTEEILGLYGLGELRDRHPHSLSEGQKRLLSIAAAVAPAPSVLCLDEPTVGQDGKSLGRLLRALEQSLGARAAVVAATHDLRFARAMGRRCLWLEEGREVERGGGNLAEKYFQRNLDLCGEQP